MPVLPFTPTVETLPTPRTPLIGRTAEIGAIRALLIDEGAPLVTPIGPGGAGKTRLALAVASGSSSRRTRYPRPAPQI